MAERNKSFEELKTAVQELLECPVCLDVTKIPFKLCCFGHMACSDCVENSLKCPSCKAPFIMDTPIVMKELIELTSMEMCQYSRDGCQEVVEPGSDYEQFCGYRPMMCREHDCTEVVQVRKIQTHYQLAHKLQTIYNRNNFYVSFHALRLNKDFFELYPLEMDNNMFWIAVYKDITAEELKITFQVTPVGKLAKDYYATVTYDNKGSVYEYTLKAVVLGNCLNKPSPINGNKDDNNDQTGLFQNEDFFCFRLPLMALVDGFDQYFRYNFHFDYFTKEIL